MWTYSHICNRFIFSVFKLIILPKLMSDWLYTPCMNIFLFVRFYLVHHMLKLRSPYLFLSLSNGHIRLTLCLLSSHALSTRSHVYGSCRRFDGSGANIRSRRLCALTAEPSSRQMNSLHAKVFGL